MDVGDVVEHRDGNTTSHLVCGSGWYDYAICVCVEPFTLVSGDGTMMWYHQERKDYVVKRSASPSEHPLAFDRYHMRGKWAHK